MCFPPLAAPGAGTGVVCSPQVEPPDHRGDRLIRKHQRRRTSVVLAAPAPPDIVDSAVASVRDVPDDEVLVARLAAGDESAIADVFDLYGAFVLHIALRVVRRRDLAEEVVQEVITRLWTDPHRFDHTRGSLRTYLGLQAHRRAVDAVRRQTRQVARETRHAADEQLRAGDPLDPETGTLTTAVVRAAIDRLPDEQRTVVDLAFWHGYSCREVAAVLAIPEGTAKSRLRLAQAKLAEWLAPTRGELV
jgi:RNA polymerase sigma-70 factor (ECF subfamily)